MARGKTRNGAAGSSSAATVGYEAPVVRMFRFVFNDVKELSPGFQVVITEHADIKEDWYQNAIVERWRGGRSSFPRSGREVSSPAFTEFRVKEGAKGRSLKEIQNNEAGGA